MLKAAFKLHPELRRRAKQAERTLADKPWRPAMRAWEDHERTAFETENLALQDVDLATLDDAGLARHYEDTLAALRRGYHRHFVLHGYDLGPIGLLLVACQRWGIDGVDVVPALQAASPATSEPARVLARLRAEVAASGTTPATLDDVRALSPEASAEVDQYLRYRGMQVFSRYDLDGVTPGRAARGGAGDDPRRARGPGHARSRRRAPRPCASACRPPSGPPSTTCSPRPASP